LIVTEFDYWHPTTFVFVHLLSWFDNNCNQQVSFSTCNKF